MRLDQSEHTRFRIERRNLAIACSVAMGGLLPIALYQLHLIDRLSDPPGRYFDSETITSSKAAHPFGIPDSLLGLASYGTTLALVAQAGESDSVRSLLAAKLVVDSGMAGFNTARQVVSFRRICAWCMVTAVATVAMTYAGRSLLLRTFGEMVDGAAKTLRAYPGEGNQRAMEAPYPTG
jgi:uncharacterized membrane protein